MLAVEESISRNEVTTSVNTNTVAEQPAGSVVTINTKKENVIPSLLWASCSATSLKTEYTVDSNTYQSTCADTGAYEIPHPEKAYKGGEDAYFTFKTNRYTILGVADGVSGWASVGVDPGLFSRAFMSHAKHLAQQGETDPVKILEGCYTHVVGLVVGSSTACIVTIDHEQNKLRAVNLGDSGFVVVRDGKIISRSSEQQHYFNAPFQLTSLLSTAVDFSHMEAHVFSSNPEEADIIECEVRRGDKVLLATDGLFDNVDISIVSQALADNKNMHPEELAEQLCSHAFATSQDPDHMSPFALGAQQAGYSCIGGKPDDITVVVAHITSPGEQSNSNSNSSSSSTNNTNTNTCTES